MSSRAPRPVYLPDWFVVLFLAVGVSVVQVYVAVKHVARAFRRPR